MHVSVLQLVRWALRLLERHGHRCDRVRLRKPVGPEAHLSSFYAICREFPGAEHPAVRDLEQVPFECSKVCSIFRLVWIVLGCFHVYSAVVRCF